MTTRVFEKSINVICSHEKGGLLFDAGFRHAKSEGLIILSNKNADDFLKSVNGGWEPEIEAFPIWTGTMTAYVGPGAKFGAAVESREPGPDRRWVFEIPVGVGLRGLKDTLLAVEYPNYDLEVDHSRKSVIITPKRNTIIPVENFPSEPLKWYATDARTAIPVNQPLYQSNHSARFLGRQTQRVGPILRHSHCTCWRTVSIDDYWSCFSFGMLAFEGDSRKRE